MLEGKPINLNGSGNKVRIIVAMIVPFNEAKPPMKTMHKIGISCNNVKLEGSMNVM